MSSHGKLRWRCRRGMKELDELLIAFLERRYDQIQAQEQQAFASLLELQDPQLYNYLLGRETPQNPIMRALVEKIVADNA